jgi:hypothetical protein
MRDPQRVLSTRSERSRVPPIIRTIRPRVLNESLGYLGELITTAHLMTSSEDHGTDLGRRRPTACRGFASLAT